MRRTVWLTLLLLSGCGGRSALWSGSDGAGGEGGRPSDLRADRTPLSRDRAGERDLTPVCAGDRDCDGDPDASDCAPDDPAIRHGAPELCNGKDDDCDGIVDEAALGCTDYYLDADGDGYGTLKECRCKPGGGYTATQGGDCYETGPRAKLVHPGQTSFFTEQRGDGSYDYDCDGIATAEHGKYSCTPKGWPSAGCAIQLGFKFDAACGLLAEFVYACFYQVGPVTCEAGIQLKTQACR